MLDATHVTALKRYASAVEHAERSDFGGKADPGSATLWAIADRVARHVAGIPVRFTAIEAATLAGAGDRLHQECEISLSHGEALSDEQRARARGWLGIAHALHDVAAGMRESASAEADEPSGAVRHG